MAAGLGRSLTAVFLLNFLVFSNLSVSERRTKRELKFPKGTAFGLTAALATHFPKGPLTDGLAHILEFDFGFPFPDQITYGNDADELKKKVWNENQYYGNKKYQVKKTREQREVREIGKRNLLKKMENVIMRLGYDGLACVSRFQCEIKQISGENSLLEELLVALFKPSFYENEKECNRFASECPISLLHVFLHSQQRVHAK
ncbi:hypothetical protein RUM43_009572 [Polyplax serrata]|uniref:Uncharacterized protein n=1 Tax=Polyplax serrata TaxID=468196 RepID=A0AAN8S4L5_POLSC